jgi:aryl-alcohol dehydrogenase-like predicted oxidoreductase
MEAIQAAKQAGKIRYIGFTGHKDPLVHLRMLEIAANHKFHFDAVQMPLNVMDAHFRSFEHQVLPLLLKDQIGVLGMKALGDPFILRSNTVTPTECLHYAMSLPDFDGDHRNRHDGGSRASAGGRAHIHPFE